MTHISGPVLALVVVAALYGMEVWTSGWAALAGAYSCGNPFDGRLWRFRKARIWRSQYRIGQMDWWLNVGADRQALYLQIWPFSLPFYPALRIPWSDVLEVQREHVAFHHYVRLHFRARPAVTLQLSEHAVREIAAEAGDGWAGSRFFSPSIPVVGP